MIAEIIFILALILLNGFFSLSEMAIVSSRKARLRHEADEGRNNYLLALRAAEQPGKFLSAIQVAITLIGILTGAIGGATFSHRLSQWLSGFPAIAGVAEPLSVVLIVLITTLVSVILGELVPKSLALARPEAVAAAIIRPLSVISFIFYPIVRFLSGATSLIVRALGYAKAPGPDVTEDEVKILIAEGAESGIFENSEKEMVEGVLNLDDRRVTSFMTPRTDVLALDLEDGNKATKEELVAQARFACLPVIEGDLDRIVGMLNVREALAALVRDGGIDIRAHLTPPVLIPETISALRALSIMKDNSARTGLIVDEYGGVSGLVTMSDLMESVVAGLTQNDSDEVPGLIERDDGSFLVDGTLAIAEFAESMDLDEEEFDTNAYDTVAGLVLECMGSIPKEGESCEWKGFHIEIVDMDGNRIDKVMVNKINEVNRNAEEE
ncbi:MAG TPA: hemolysin family protein [Rectinemataceae bacterium]|nr:hemolysin family protein [Rectinemataceae bacterium]